MGKGWGRGRGELLVGDKLSCVIYMSSMCVPYFDFKIKTNVTKDPESSDGSLVCRGRSVRGAVQRDERGTVGGWVRGGR